MYAERPLTPPLRSLRSPAEVDAIYKQIVAARHRGVKEPWDASWGQRYAVLEDPDGAQVSIFAPR